LLASSVIMQEVAYATSILGAIRFKENTLGCSDTQSHVRRSPEPLGARFFQESPCWHFLRVRKRFLAQGQAKEVVSLYGSPWKAAPAAN
jgi:hypothetical protein